ncbi:exocyst complex component 2 [Trichogramma pretiosum]|uniref:exocyst complex component 2 n=1 Tax=Trichogramma pretiosum TaxID=7493 RepID=UPI0006C983D3|nr:exocyst complex component 2 [Trichogramma pretiosum]
MAPPPVVTGISPKEGPPGTRITIRGEFLGSSLQDLIGLTICGCDCILLAEWKSPNKIIARSGACKGRGDIIVTTRSGGQGTSTVQFRGYHETIGPLKESAVWVEEAPIQSYVWGRRALSPTNQQDDLLGISVEENEGKKFPEDELFELFGDASSDLTSEKFHPGMFLLQNHHATSFDDLKAGLSHLQRKVNSQKEGQLSFLKANVGTVMEQLDTLTLLKEQYESDIAKYGKKPLEKLEGSIKKSMGDANQLFNEVLARRERADATRNALAVMQRYKFLFCMPVNIEKNMKNGNYDLIINDYARVKNLFKNTDVDVFKKVLREVDYRIETLRDVLKKKLEEVPFTLEDQKKIIRHLINLETDGDPAWDAIASHANYLKKSIEACTNEYLGTENKEDGGKEVYIKTDSSTPLSVRQFKLTKTEENNAPSKVLCIEALCDIVMEQLPDLWRLGQCYFTGQLHVTVDTEKQEPFKNLVLSNIRLAVNSMKATCDASLTAPWLLHNLKCIRHLYAALIHLDLPSDALDIFGKFIFDLRSQCLVGILKQTEDNVMLLARKETWEIEYLDKNEGVTKLPSQFEQMVVESAKLARETAVERGPRETALFDEAAQRLLFHEAIKKLFRAFTCCLRELAFSGSDDVIDDEITTVSHLTGSPSPYRIRDSKLHGPTAEECLLISLSNIHYTLKVILPQLTENLKAQEYPDLTTAIGFNTDWTQLESLDKAVLEAYLERRSDPLIGTIEPSMYVGDLDWDSDLPARCVKPYTQEIVANVITVHAEVCRISPRLLKRVLSHIVENIAEEVSRVFSCVKSFSHEGVVQGRTDILFLRKALESFSSHRAKCFFDEALNSIPKITRKDDIEKIDILLTKVYSRMRLQLSCLKDSVDSRVDVENLNMTRLTIV